MDEAPLAAPLPPPPVKTTKSTSGRRAAAPKPAQVRPASRLGDYMARAELHPKLASHLLIAQVRFLQGEEAYAPYAASRLKQPLDRLLANGRTIRPLAPSLTGSFLEHACLGCGVV